MNALALHKSINRIDWQAPWPRHLRALALCIAALLILFARDAAHMATIWWNISTYTHCLFIVPLAAWLVWQRQTEIAAMQPVVWLPALSVVGAGAFGWLLGEAAGVALFRHAGLVLMLQGAIITMLGRQLSQALAFPIFYLSFLVPFGEELVPFLQTITAKMCMVFLAWSGIPARIEGVFITTPAGLFEVAEACSGVKFLVAMAAYATLATNVCFRSWKRRTNFLAFGLIVPVIANGVRAFATIWLSGIWGTEFAASVDHIVWGWFFFGFVMILVMAAAWPFFDRSLDGDWVSEKVKAMAKPAAARSPLAGVLAILIIGLTSMGWSVGAAALGRTPVEHGISLPEVPGWTRVDARHNYPWNPRFDGADHRLTGHYRNAAGQEVDLVVALYGWQGEGREIIGFGQGAFDPESEWSWTRASAAPNGGKSDVIFAPGSEREVASFYSMGGKSTGSASRAKLDTLMARLTGGDQSAVAVLISAEAKPGLPTRPAIDAFLKDLGAIDTLSTRLVAQARGQ